MRIPVSGQQARLEGVRWQPGLVLRRIDRGWDGYCRAAWVWIIAAQGARYRFGIATLAASAPWS